MSDSSSSSSSASAPESTKPTEVVVHSPQPQAQPQPQPRPQLVYPIQFGDYPQGVHCPRCKRDVVTTVYYINGSKTWIACLVIMTGSLVTGLSWMCCWIPFCMNECKDVEHFCPRCNHYFGVKRQC